MALSLDSFRLALFSSASISVAPRCVPANPWIRSSSLRSFCLRAPTLHLSFPYWVMPESWTVTALLGSGLLILACVPLAVAAV